MKAIILAGTRGIGKSVADNLSGFCEEIISPGKSEVDTSDLSSVKTFATKHPGADILILNTGGPPAMPFKDITEEVWLKYFNQLFLSFMILLKEIKINSGGYIFLISSFNIKEPADNLILSNSLRLASWSVLKSLSKRDLKEDITYINIAPGPTETDRLRDLASKDGKSLLDVAESLPTKRISSPDEIGRFVRSLVEQRIKAVNGVSINFDMGLSNSVL